MGYIVPFMNNKGGTGKSVLARAYAVEAARTKASVLIIDAPGWTDRENLKMARWSTFCVIPSRANRMDDLSETVRLLYALKAQGIEDWRYGVALNALRAATAAEDDRDARAYLAEAGFEALPGFVRDLKAYEVALLEGKAITETPDRGLNEEAYQLVNGIAGARLDGSSREVEHDEMERRIRLEGGWTEARAR